MSDHTIGRLLVVVQVALLAALVLLPAGDDFKVASWLQTASTIALVLGLAIVAVGALALGRALTASPVPNESGSLRTGGPYRFVRHPIYTGVLLIVAFVNYDKETRNGQIPSFSERTGKAIQRSKGTTRG